MGRRRTAPGAEAERDANPEGSCATRLKPGETQTWRGSSGAGPLDADTQLAAETESDASAQDGQGARGLAELIQSIINGSAIGSECILDEKCLVSIRQWDKASRAIPGLSC